MGKTNFMYYQLKCSFSHLANESCEFKHVTARSCSCVDGAENHKHICDGIQESQNGDNGQITYEVETFTSRDQNVLPDIVPNLLKSEPDKDGLDEGKHQIVDHVDESLGNDIAPALDNAQEEAEKDISLTVTSSK